MPKHKVYQCPCEKCQNEDGSSEKTQHHQINLLLSRLDEQQRRWYVAVEANRIGEGGVSLLAQITGMDEKTIRRGRAEVAQNLSQRPTDQIRLAGGGRPRAEKKSRK
jgi:hypothetical protein